MMDAMDANAWATVVAAFVGSALPILAGLFVAWGRFCALQTKVDTLMLQVTKIDEGRSAVFTLHATKLAEHERRIVKLEEVKK